MLEGDIDDICPSDCQVLNSPMDPFCIEKHLFYPVLDAGQEDFIKNRALSIKEISDGRTILSSLPSRLMFHPSDACNLNCVMCDQADKRTQANPNARMYKEAESLYSVLEEIKFVGGEPLLDEVSKGIIYGFDSKKHPNCRLAMVTNGTLLTPGNVARLLTKNLGWVEISLDAATKSTYENIRINGRWEHTLGGIERLLHSRKAAGKCFPVYLSMVVQKMNLNEISAFVDLGFRFGAQVVFSWVRGTDELIGCETDLRRSILGGSARARRLGYTSAIVALERFAHNERSYLNGLTRLKPRRDWRGELIDIDKKLFDSRLIESYRSVKYIGRKLLRSSYKMNIISGAVRRLFHKEPPTQ